MHRITYTMLAAAILMAVSGCKKMDDIYSEYVVPNGMVYPAKASSPMVYAGKERVQVSWLRGNDPNVTQAIIYWNNFADSITVPIPLHAEVISQIIQPLNEGTTYSFVIKTFDDEGHVSVPVEISGKAYGARYQAGLLARPISRALVDVSGKLTLEWADADVANGAIATEVIYKDVNDVERVLQVSADSAETQIDNYKGGLPFRFRTAYIPDSLSIDTFYTAYESSSPFAFDKKDWSVVAVSSEHPGAANLASNMIDGTDATRWHAHATASDYPHFVTFDLGTKRLITHLGVSATTNAGNPVDLRGPDVIQFFISDDNVNWTDLGIFDFNRAALGEQLYDFPSNPQGRYVKLVAVSGPERYTVLGEFSAYGY